MIDHLDLSVRDPGKSRAFYEAVLGYLGYTRIRQHEDGFDFDMPGELEWRCSIGLRKSRGEGENRAHDRYSPGLHHVAFHAQARSDVDRLHGVLIGIGAVVLDAPAEYPQFGTDYYAVFLHLGLAARY